MKRLFSVGDLRVSNDAKEMLEETTDGLWDLLIRHITGDWGEMIGPEIARINQKHLLSDGALTSAYRVGTFATVMFVTNSQRTETSVFTFEEFVDASHETKMAGR